MPVRRAALADGLGVCVGVLVFGVWGLGFGIWDLGFGFSGLGSGVKGLVFDV